MFRNISVAYILYIVVKFFILEKDARESNSIEIKHKMKILTVVFMLLFNWL